MSETVTVQGGGAGVGSGSSIASSAGVAPPVNEVIGGKEGLTASLSGWFAKKKNILIIGVIVGLLYVGIIRYIKAKGKDPINPNGEHPQKNKILQVAESFKNK